MNEFRPKKRRMFAMFFLPLITGGLYFWYWLYQTKKDINKLGGQIPTYWFAIIPILHLYFSYCYARDFVKYVRHEQNNKKIFGYFVFMLFPVSMFLVQYRLNHYQPAAV